MAYQWQTCDFGSLNTLELYAALRLRQQIFVLEQNCLYLDLDNLDQVLRLQPDHADAKRLRALTIDPDLPSAICGHPICLHCQSDKMWKWRT